MSKQSQIETLITWFQTYDYNVFRNEAEVESKFVHPAFRLLGYTDEMRYDKHPIKAHASRKPGRPEEADQVYFTVADINQQNEDTCLILVEAKSIFHKNLDDEVLTQAKHYAEVLKPILIVLTNGIQLKVFRRERFKKETLILDIDLSELKEPEKAKVFFEELNFLTTSQIKEALTDNLTHKQYVRLEQALRKYPDIQSILDEGDFIPASFQEGNQITIVKPKVQITCKLPIAFDEGNCSIKFSDIRRRGLQISLNHQDILGDFMSGLHTSPNTSTRRFLRKLKDGSFEVRLGQVITVLSSSETQDLCDCVDTVFGEYKNRILAADKILETTNFELKCIETIPSFYLFSVKLWLWKLMKKFAREFDYSKGKTEWHIFDNPSFNLLDLKPKPSLTEKLFSQFFNKKNSPSMNSTHFFDDSPIKVTPKLFRQCTIWPLIDEETPRNDYVDLFFSVNSEHFEFFEKLSGESWRQNVGSAGFWTANYTKKWLHETFIPHLLSYYSKDIKYNNQQDYIFEKGLSYVSFQDIKESKHLVYYLHEVQEWLHTYGANNITTSLIHPYYTTFTRMIQRVEPTTLNISYIREKLAVIEDILYREEGGATDQWDFAKIMTVLDKHVARVAESKVEYPEFADLISRVFISILSESKLNVTQIELNKAKDALLPLLEQSRFEQRFVFPHKKYW